MSVLTEKFKNYLDQKGIRYTYYEATEERNEALKFEFKGEKKDSITLYFFFDKNDRSVNVKGFDIAKVPEEKLMDAYVLINQLNSEYRWVKFFLADDNTVIGTGDAVLDVSNVAEECEEILFRYLDIIDKCYPRFMKVIWA